MEKNQENTYINNKPEPKSKFLKWVIAGGIVIVLNLLFNYGIATFYGPAPEWNDFCSAEVDAARPISKTEFEEPRAVSDARDNLFETCRESYDSARGEYEQVVFVILVVLGLLAVIASFLVKSHEAVSLGLSLGGVLSFIIGSMRYWQDMGDKMRFVVLAIALIVLIYLGVKKIKD